MDDLASQIREQTKKIRGLNKNVTTDDEVAEINNALDCIDGLVEPFEELSEMKTKQVVKWTKEWEDTE